MKIAPVHPFPARMAPEIAIAELNSLPFGSLVIDPMMGSGTVLRHAVELGHTAMGFDLDPLAVLMSKVWSTSVDCRNLDLATGVLRDVLPQLKVDDLHLPWIDEDDETEAFINFWFGERQRKDLRRLAFAIGELRVQGGSQLANAVDVLRVAMSRIIITKGSGASLAWDTSHSRPHKVASKSAYDVASGFFRSVEQIKNRIISIPEKAKAKALQGDARNLRGVRSGMADAVLTSPPYLNAIDYMRGHKLSLVWLGHSVSELRTVRSDSIGAERKATVRISPNARLVQAAMVDGSTLRANHLSMVERYSHDLVKSLSQAARVLKPEGKAIYVVGNSCLRGIFIKNSEGVKKAAEMAGFRLLGERVRDLPNTSRYLPMPDQNDSALGKRMRTESILTFESAA